MRRHHNNPMYTPQHYAVPASASGPPVTAAAARRLLPSYDYVIVGAGAAGCVLASKLSENENVSVLLLEAGGDNTGVLATKVPLMAAKLFHSNHDWDYYTVEQKALASRRLYWPRGRIIGGSSSMNAMIYHRCSASDFDEWVSAYGCKGWGYEDLLPHFRYVENFTPDLETPANTVDDHGRAGRWQVGYSWISQIVEDGFLPACHDVGILSNSDVNAANGSLGMTRFQTSIDTKGQRSSLATSFLTPDVIKRPNLYIGCEAYVTRVLFDQMNKKPAAIGVEFQTMKGGVRYHVHAEQEVILSAGSVNTPQTLMLSGVGPEEELQKHGIPLLVKNNNVGRRLKDHLCSSAVLCKAKAGSTLDYLADDVKAIPSLIRWLLFGSGPLTSNAAEAAAFIRTFEHVQLGFTNKVPNNYTSGSASPDLEIVGLPVALIHHGEERPLHQASVFSLLPVGLRPQSSGTIKLRNADVFDHPIIDPMYLSDEENNDKQVLISGLRLCLRIMRSPSFQRYLEPVPTNDDPSSYWWPYSCSDIDTITDEQLGRYLIEKAFTLYHPVGSARMGPSPSDSVVDLECCVHGTDRLRIVDASIFPEQVSGHPTAPIAAIAHKASVMIMGRPKE